MASSYLESAEEDLTCPLCMEYFVDPHTPKELDCPHVYCYMCLVKMVKNDPLKISCPECRTVTQVPQKSRRKKGGIASFKTQLRLRSLAEKHMTHTDACSSLDVNGSQIPTCPKHEGEKMHFYCMTCKVLICQMCILLNHERRVHDIQGVNVAREEKLKIVKDIVERCEQQVKKCEQQAQASSKLEVNIQSAITATELKIDDAVAMAVDKALEQGQMMKAELKQKYEEQLSICQKQIKDWNEKASAMKDTLSHTHKITDQSSCHEYLLQYDQLLENLKLEEASISEDEGEIQIKLNVKPKKFTMVPEVDVTLGKLTAVRQLKLIPTTDSFNDLLFGIASHPCGTLAVGTRENNNLRIYDKQETGQYRKKFSFALSEVEKDNPGRDVAIAEDGHYLVARSKYVEIYDQSGGFVSTMYTQQDQKTDNVALTSITTTPDGRVIVGDRWRSVITVHPPDGSKVIKTIKSSFPPLRIASINSTHIVISDKSPSPTKICVMDLESEKETLNIDIKKSSSVCYDEEMDCLLICKWNGTEYVNEQYNWATGEQITPSCIT